jgi:DNA repair protein RecO
MVEVAESQTAQEDPASGTYRLLVESLEDLRDAPSSDADKHLWRFMLRFLASEGYRPGLDRCIACGKQPKGGSVFFSFVDGGIVCSCTVPGDRFGIHVSPGALMLMQELMTAKAVSLGRLKMTKAQRSEVEHATLRFLAYHTGYSRPPRSLAFLRKMDGAVRDGDLAE